MECDFPKANVMQYEHNVCMFVIDLDWTDLLFIGDPCGVGGGRVGGIFIEGEVEKSFISRSYGSNLTLKNNQQQQIVFCVFLFQSAVGLLSQLCVGCFFTKFLVLTRRH